MAAAVKQEDEDAQTTKDVFNPQPLRQRGDVDRQNELDMP